jgi:hypothetical protein
MKPRVFIASSLEGISLAYAAQSNLQHDAECTVWDQGVFTPSDYPIDDIVAELSRSDFGIFVFSPDDVVSIRDEEKKAVRDNVIFELGLFMGYLSRERTFILQPHGIQDLRIPTDLTGIKPAAFETGRQDRNDRAALGPACDEVRKVIKKLGSLDIRITKPRSGDTIRTRDRGGKFDFEGEFVNLPGDDVFALTNKDGEWWPQPYALRQIGEKRWAVTVHFGTYGPHSIYIVKADELGSVLVRYYRKVCRVNLERKEQLKGNVKAEGKAEKEFLRGLRGDFPGIEMARLPKGLKLLDKIDVIVEPPPPEKT